MNQNTALVAAVAASALVGRAAFSQAIEDASLVIERRTTYPILYNARIRSLDGRMLISATDLDMELHIALDGAADAGFDITAPAMTLKHLLKAAPASDMLAFSAGEWSERVPNGGTPTGKTEVDFETTRTDLICLSPEDFPNDLQPGKFSHTFTLSGGDLVEMLSAVEFAISNEETRYYLNGIYLHTVQQGPAYHVLRAVATDGHRMARHEMAVPDGAAGMPGVILPKKVVAVLLRLMKGKRRPAEVKVEMNAAKVRFQWRNITLTAKFIDGTFPDYERVTPKNNERLIRVATNLLAAAVNTVSKVASTRGGKAVKIAVTHDKLTLSVNGFDTGSATMDVAADTSNFGAGEFEIGFNSSYLADILDHVEDPMVALAINDAGSPMLIKPDSSYNRRLFVQMPMRV